MLERLLNALNIAREAQERVEMVGSGALDSAYRVTDLAAAALASAGAAVAELIATRRGTPPAIVVDQRLASLWFASSIRPIGWKLPPVWDPVAGDYQARDGWIRLHTNAPHHRQAALDVLQCPAERERVAATVADWSAEALETAVVEHGGCAAKMRLPEEWAQHPHGRSVAGEPDMYLDWQAAGPTPAWLVPAERPLAGVRVLDLTRVLAGPIATRFLAAYGADVLRIDAPEWDEPGLIPEVTPGKRCARLDLRQADGRQTLAALVGGCDVLVHGYRADALERLGFGPDALRRLRPGLVDVALDAYGWAGPWRNRRGFDSLVQMSSGIAAEGMRWRNTSHAPVPLPVQGLDHATGYLLAAAVVKGLIGRLTTGAGLEARTSLAKTAEILQGGGPNVASAALQPEGASDLAPGVEETGWGPTRRLRPPVCLDGAPMRWDRPAEPLGSSAAAW